MSNHNVNAAELRKALDECSKNNLRNELVDMLIDNHPTIFLKLMAKFDSVQVVFTHWGDGDKISAIKLIQDFTGLSLTDAKKASEEIENGKPFLMYFKKIISTNSSFRLNLDTPEGTTTFSLKDANTFLAHIQSHTSCKASMKFEIKS